MKNKNASKPLTVEQFNALMAKLTAERPKPSRKKLSEVAREIRAKYDNRTVAGREEKQKERRTQERDIP